VKSQKEMRSMLLKNRRKAFLLILWQEKFTELHSAVSRMQNM
jgi:hypothetical protein